MDQAKFLAILVRFHFWASVIALLCFHEGNPCGSGLWGDACKASPIDKENCALACVSSSCYDSVYGFDPVSFSSGVVAATD